MKKILSVVLAGAMILGMSVSAFAKTANDDVKEWGNASTGECYEGKYDVAALEFQDSMDVHHTDGTWEAVSASDDYKDMKVGDELYFWMIFSKSQNYFNHVQDKHWSINIKGNDYVDNAEWTYDKTNGRLGVKVTIVEELDNLKAQNVKLQMYIADNGTEKQHGIGLRRNESGKVNLTYSFDNYIENYVDFGFTNDVDYMSKWVVAKDDKGTATFDFEDEAYFTVKMIPEEKVIFNFSQAYDKDIDKEYNEYDADLSFYNFKGTKDEFTKVGELFIPADKDTYIYEVVDGELVEVDAEYTKDYKYDGVDKADGWVIKTRELGYYVVADDELVVAEEEDNATEEKPSTDKQNPAMGANDFVGAAVALAVVSVAAAGALALKK